MASTTPVLCGSIAGRPGRLGVAMHTAGYRALGLDWVYVAFGTEDTEGAVAAMRPLGIRGLGVTTPHKIRIMACLDEVDDEARTIGAVNTVVNDGGRLRGLNVDWIGAVRAFEEQLSLLGRHAVVVGAGGGARAIVYGLIRAGARVTLLNRSAERGAALAHALGARYAGPPERIDEIEAYDLLVHATPVGFHDPDATLIDRPALRPGTVVFDAVAQPPRTRLLRDAESRGCRTISGVRMQLHQAVCQFGLYTGLTLDLKIMEDALEKAIRSS
jgi:shikimate dehydrogenase